MKFLQSSIVLLCLIVTSCTSKKQDIVLEQRAVPALGTQEITTPQDTRLASAVIIPEAPEASFRYVTATSGLSLRKASNLRSKKLLTLPYGAQVELLEKPAYTSLTIDGIEGAMVRVSYQGAEGFIFDGYTSRLAPPQEDEPVSDYAKRVAAAVPGVQLRQTPNPKGELYGMNTTLVLPLNTWDEAYAISKKLFTLPKKLNITAATQVSKKTFINPKKNEHALKDELVLTRNAEGKIDRIQYDYLLRDYSRSVTIEKNKTGFVIKEIESSK